MRPTWRRSLEAVLFIDWIKIPRALCLPPAHHSLTGHWLPNWLIAVSVGVIRRFVGDIHRRRTIGPIGRHPTSRTKIAVVPDGRPTVTHYRIAQRFGAHTHLDVGLESGRTHRFAFISRGESTHW